METNPFHTRHAHDYSPLIEDLVLCALTCEKCAADCQEDEQAGKMARCIALDRDCAEICSQAALLLQRRSEVSALYLSVCEDVCRLCAEECRKHDNEHCRRCAETCWECAKACQEHNHMISV